MGATYTARAPFRSPPQVVLCRADADREGRTDNHHAGAPWPVRLPAAGDDGGRRRRLAADGAVRQPAHARGGGRARGGERAATRAARRADRGARCGCPSRSRGPRALGCGALLLDPGAWPLARPAAGLRRRRQAPSRASPDRTPGRDNRRRPRRAHRGLPPRGAAADRAGAARGRGRGERPRVDGSRRRRRRDAPARGARAGEPGRRRDQAPPGDHVGRGEEHGSSLALSAAASRPSLGLLDGEGPREWLLHGVTGPAATEVYLAAIEAALERGRTAILLVPEIGLTLQTLGRPHPASATPPRHALGAQRGRALRRVATVASFGEARCASGPARPFAPRRSRRS